ncbi:UDP-N-acetylmuramoyl-L-alanine--D-glutamate ligase [Tissierella creatinini]|nr:UDP-N-acetylmuramoyl-L-alanine--D-glutamate ligase [Tissierella creatinini]TJX64431.1 UDP-N-acetylmuramoyl-L-alanine--D-glutamate ligase [Soehngenia saccharolytica]
MYLKDKRILILGLGITGISAIKAVHQQGGHIVIHDSKAEEKLKDILEEVKNIPMTKYLAKDDIDLKGIDLIVKSPGIPPYATIVKRALENNIEVITDIELAYRLSKTKNFIAITGTNGKTTCTTLIGEIFKKAGINTHVVGNIGTGILEKIVEEKEKDLFVIECSSFQLEHISTFKPRVSLITNITPDHLDWHGNFDSYKKAKLNIMKNQDSKDYLILNYDDPILRKLNSTIKPKVIWFSIKEELSHGIYIKDNYIVISYGIESRKLMPYSQLKILGKHNLENALACIGVSIAIGIDYSIIRQVLASFRGVEHRIEYVAVKNGITFYNDSKGTNCDASIKAIEAVDSPIILIAGGYDKGSNFDEFIKSFKGKVKILILLGQTKERLKEAAINNGFVNIYEVNSMKKAVELSYELGEIGDKVLLSPACASWDMYSSYEVRGNDFKDAVRKLME